MVNVNLDCGRINKFLEIDHVLELQKTFKRFHFQDGTGNNCYGVDQQHLGYLWFRKKVLDRINTAFATDSKLIFAMLLDCVTPFDIHNDIKPLPEPQGRHWRSFLIPISVNNSVDLVQNASTLIFDQCYADRAAWQSGPDIENNIQSIHEEKISHVEFDKLSKFTLRQELIWNTGDLLWWDSALCHVSNNFCARGFESKQAIVLHTYVI